ncbi:hypothetical protein EXE44_15600 [Halorubrum sp. SS7]|uniref:hypothetical protein n=1 Tax=unclassified Halorubrum TaxID=2642239 RepID=UPI0010F993A6|nr:MULTISPECIES: hypothetical protein [unclassified Halorubrum]TKX55578.1 hypothetical protein EXE42_03685 [Halorubrum sp. SP3]TKX56296.1 hypothetical protein EXE44_15600 [Halorubrum sp. SS7]TKX65672.1 hypothetical protein EXE45_15910 [Halorubrum sp. SP9]
MPLPTQSENFYYICYREVRSEDELERDIIDEPNEVTNVEELLRAVHNNVEYTHSLESLDVTTYFENWVETLLDDAEGLVSGMSRSYEQTLSYMAEDFAGSMKSRARERGKYVVFIISEDSLVVCHSFTGKKALTTDMDVIEELLSEANIDKYARFTYESPDEIVVQHFDRHDTESFSEWLGIPEDEIAFDIKGSVRVYTKIDGINTVFEFDQEDITTKLLGSDSYDLSAGQLKTPNESPRRVEKIRWGHKKYADIDEFKQELLKTNRNLSRAFDMYNNHISNSLDSFFTVTDYENKIVKETANGAEEIKKPKVDFALSFVNNQVEMHVPWRSELSKHFLSEHEPIPICHAGAEFSESAYQLGNFRIYNEITLTGAQETYIKDVLKTAEDMGSNNLRDVFSHIVFEILSRDVQKPLCYLFNEFSSEFHSRFVSSVSDATRVVQTEGEEIDLEFKSSPWFDRQSDVEELAQGIHREFQDSRLLFLGISEDSKDIDVIESGVKSEKLNDIEDKLENKYGVAESHVWSIPIDDGHGIIALNIENLSQGFDTDISVLERS